MSAREVPIEEISRLVGHAGTAITEAVYRQALRPVLTDGAEVVAFPSAQELGTLFGSLILKKIIS